MAHTYPKVAFVIVEGFKWLQIKGTCLAVTEVIGYSESSYLYSKLDVAYFLCVQRLTRAFMLRSRYVRYINLISHI